MVRTITTTVMTLSIKEKDSDNIKLVTKEFIGTGWTQVKMYNNMKKDVELVPAGATVENITTETKFNTYKLSDEGFVRAAIAEMDSAVDEPEIPDVMKPVVTE
jgi:hypothetical protein